MKTVGNLKVSALNLVPIREGQSDKEAIEDMISLAQKLDSLIMKDTGLQNTITHQI